MQKIEMIREDGKFQSALRSGERSDDRSRLARPARASFNPRFAPESEAIGPAFHGLTPRVSFNPRFAPESEAIEGRRAVQ